MTATNTNTNHSINIFLVIFILYKLLFQNIYTYTFENRLNRHFVYNIEKDIEYNNDLEKTIYIYQLPINTKIDSFEEIRNTYSSKWMEIKYYKTHGRMVCNHKVIRHGGAKEDSIMLYNENINSINDCYEFIYDPEYYYNITKYIIDMNRHKWHYIERVISYVKQIKSK